MHRTRAKWVFVPNHAVGRTLGDRLALAGTDWANLRFITPLDIALRMGGPFLVARGIDPSEEGLGPALTMRLLLDQPENGGYFRPLADQPTMAQALWSTIRELRMAGIRANDLPAQAFSSPAKYLELRALLGSYEQFLAVKNRGDMAVVYEEALQHSDWCPIQSTDCWTELPDARWTPLQRKLIDAMPGEHVLPRTIDLPGTTTPRRFAGGNVERIHPDTDTSPLAFLMQAGKAASSLPLCLFHAGGSDAEIEEVFRRILASGRSLDQIEIACASSRYAALVWEKALRYEWPVSISCGVPASMTRPGRALLALCAWIESDFTAGMLRRLLESGDCKLAPELDLTPGQAARLLAKSEAGWGRATYNISLGRLFKRYEKTSADPERSIEQRDAAAEKAGRVDSLSSWIAKLLDSMPTDGQEKKVGLQSTVEAALSFVSSCAATASALDGAALIALKDALSELRALGGFRCQLPVALSFIRDCVASLAVGRDRCRPGHLHVSMLSRTDCANRPLLFVVGLEEGRVFPPAAEDPVLLDSERRVISPLLPCASDRVEEAVQAVLARLAMAGTVQGAEVCLSYSCRDLREYRQTAPSWLLLQAYRLQTGDGLKSYSDLQTSLGVPKSCVPESEPAALSELGWWLNGLKLAGSAGVDSVLLRYPSLAQGQRAAMERASDVFGAYDGFVPAAGVILDPCAREQPVSATQLEAAAKCPFRHFLERGLGLEAVDEDERDSDVWLDPMTRGLELHDLYAAMLGKCRDEQRKPDFPSDRLWLCDRAQQRLHTLSIEMPPPSNSVFEREVQDFIADVELFLTAECEPQDGRTPIAFEVSFGRLIEGDENEPLAQADPIVIDLGAGLRFRLAGRIDRIDQIGDSSFEIIDYKTGGYFADNWKGNFAGGRRLQHALYGLAAVELLKRKYARPVITGGVYYFSSAKGQQERRTIFRPSSSALAEVLADLRQVIASGTFVHADDESPCEWCNFSRACGQQAPAQARNKQRDPKLAAYRKLVAHE